MPDSFPMGWHDALFILQRLERIDGREGGRLATQPCRPLSFLSSASNVHD